MLFGNSHSLVSCYCLKKFHRCLFPIASHPHGDGYSCFFLVTCRACWYSRGIYRFLVCVWFEGNRRKRKRKESLNENIFYEIKFKWKEKIFLLTKYQPNIKKNQFPSFFFFFFFFFPTSFFFSFLHFLSNKTHPWNMLVLKGKIIPMSSLNDFRVTGMRRWHVSARVGEKLDCACTEGVRVGGRCKR